MDPHMWQEKNWKEVWICDPGDDVEILVLYPKWNHSVVLSDGTLKK